MKWLFLLGISHLSDPEPTRLVTPVYDLKTGQLVYTEERVQNDLPEGPGVWSFIYRDARGNVIARREVDFRKNRFVPDYRLEDLRDGYTEGSVTRNGGIDVYAKRNSKTDLQKEFLSVPGMPVVDAGFHFLIDQKWETLIRGEIVPFNFVAPIEKDYFGFRVRKTGTGKMRDREIVRFSVEIDQWFLRMFVEPIRLTYDLQTRQLLVYEGISNINNADGKSYRVRMTFNYPKI